MYTNKGYSRSQLLLFRGLNKPYYSLSLLPAFRYIILKLLIGIKCYLKFRRRSPRGFVGLSPINSILNVYPYFSVRFQPKNSN